MPKIYPDWVASIPVKINGKNGAKIIWNRCGVGFENPAINGKTRSISVRLNSFPREGELVLFPFEQDRGEK